MKAFRKFLESAYTPSVERVEEFDTKYNKNILIDINGEPLNEKEMLHAGIKMNDKLM